MNDENQMSGVHCRVDETNLRLRPAMTRRLLRRAVSHGEITLPAAPGMLDEYVEMCNDLFASLGVRFTAEELAQLRSVLEGQLAYAYAASPRSDIVITYESSVGLSINYHVKAQWFTVQGAYDNWVADSRHRCGNRTQHAGPGRAWTPGRRGRDDREIRRHHPRGSSERVTGCPGHPARRV